MHSIKNVIVGWEPYTKDQIAIGPIPESDATRKFLCTWGAGDDEVQNADFEKRKTLCFINAMQIIVSDRLHPVAVHNVFCQIEEYADGLSHDVSRKIDYDKFKRWTDEV